VAIRQRKPLRTAVFRLTLEKVVEMTPARKSQDIRKQEITRRDFLKGAGLLLAGGLLSACSTVTEPGFQVQDFWRTPTPASLLPSPMPADLPQTGDSGAAPDPQELAAFLSLSSLLTGFENLDPVLGQVYLGSIQQDPGFSGQLQGLIEQAGVQSQNPPAGIEDLQAAGIFDQESARELADYIISMWYTGIYNQGEEQRVATFVDALAWKAINFTKPPTICGSFGFWAERPSGDFSS